MSATGIDTEARLRQLRREREEIYAAMPEEKRQWHEQNARECREFMQMVDDAANGKYDRSELPAAIKLSNDAPIWGIISRIWPRFLRKAAKA